MPFDGENYPIAPITPKIATYPTADAIGVAFQNVMVQGYFYSRCRQLVSYQTYRHWLHQEAAYQASQSDASVDPVGSFIAQTTDTDFLRARKRVSNHMTHAVGMVFYKSFHSREATFTLEISVANSVPTTVTAVETYEVPTTQPAIDFGPASLVLERDFLVATVEVDISTINNDECEFILRGFETNEDGGAQYFRPYFAAIVMDVRG